MAENKKSFIAYVDWKETFNSLPDEKAGQLVKHLFAYVSDENPITNDVLINAVFANIKQTLKRDLRKYEIIREKRVIAGKASADKRQQVLTSVDKQEQVNPVSVNVNDNVNVSDSVNKEKKNKYASFVSMTKKEYETLISNHGEKNTLLLIEILNNYKGANGKKYKSDYLAVLNWVVDKAKKEGKYEQKPKFVF
jgi:hypothetical protein